MATTGNGVLIVRVFKHPKANQTTGAEDETTKRVPGVQVELTKPPDTFGIGARTNADGEARFEFLGEGDYVVTVTAPEGYKDRAAEPVHVGPSGETLQLMELELKPVKVKVKVQKGKLPASVTSVRVNARQNVKALSPLFVELGTEQELTINTPGEGVELRPESPLVADELTYVSDPPSRVVSTLPGSAPSAEFTYELRPASILLDATSVKTVDGEVERELLSGVTFELSKDLVPTDPPLRQAVSSNRSATLFSDLEEGQYAIVASLPEALEEQGLQQTQPQDPVLRVAVAEGEIRDLRGEFEFQPALGSVEGAVVLDRDNSGVAGVRLTLFSLGEPRTVQTATTSSSGEYVFSNLRSGSYTVVFEQLPVSALGASWTPRKEASHRVEVRPRATAQVEDFRLVEEEHLLFGRVEGPDGQPVAFAAVRIRSSADPTDPTNVLATVLTNEKGEYEFRAPTPGTFFVSLVEEDGFTRQSIPVNVNQPAQAPTLVAFTRRSATPTSGDGARPPATPDATDFPILTEEVDLAGRAQPAAGRGGVGSTGQTVERAMRDVLGWRPRTSDPRGFLAALGQAFTSKEVEGHTEYTWNPRGYAVEVQADMGAITGAQASIYARAKNTLDQVGPLLDRLKPLDVDADPEETEALRSIVRSEVSELAGELAVEGGPRVQRVDQLFQLLLGTVTTFGDPAKVGGNLGRLRDAFGLSPARVNTIDEERNLTDFRVLVDYVAALEQSWQVQRDFFDRGNTVAERFLGTQLVLLSRALAVASESVREVEFTMDSVFLGPAERQTLELRFPPGSKSSLVLRTGVAATGSSPPMFVAELLAWVERFTTEEGPQLIREGGRLGVRTFEPTIDLLRSLVRDALVAPAGAQDPTKLPASYRVPRVQRAIGELADQLDDCFELAEQVVGEDEPVQAEQPGIRVRVRRDNGGPGGPPPPPEIE